MNATSRCKLGIIGCGNISQAYIDGLRPYGNVEIAAVADLDLERARAKAAAWGVRGGSVEELLADSEIGLVINLTTPGTHAAVNTAILEAGKHAYTEKPFALSFAEGCDVLALAERRGLRVGCAPDTFLGGSIQTACGLIDSGMIGKPVAAVANRVGQGHESWHPNPDFYYQPGGGPMLDMGPYYVTALVALLGPISRVTGSARTSPAERLVGTGPHRGRKIEVRVPTHYVGVLEFASGAVASLNISFDVWSHRLPFIEIYGTEGSMSLPDPNSFEGAVEVRRFDEASWHQVPLTHNDRVQRGIGVADMALAIAKQRPHRASGQLALHVLEAMLAVETASEQDAHIALQSTATRPETLPPGLPLGELER